MRTLRIWTFVTSVLAFPAVSVEGIVGEIFAGVEIGVISAGVVAFFVTLALLPG